MAGVMEMCLHDYPDKYFLYHDKIQQVVEHLIGAHAVAPYPLSSFQAPWNEPLDFYINRDGGTSNDPVAIILCGEPACGKSKVALAQFRRPILVKGEPALHAPTT